MNVPAPRKRVMPDAGEGRDDAAGARKSGKLAQKGTDYGGSKLKTGMNLPTGAEKNKEIIKIGKAL